MAALPDPAIASRRPIRVLVVDDSVVIRRLVAHALEEDPLLEVVGYAANGVIALAKIPQVNPDVVTLDIEMPEMDGLETLRRIRREYPKLRVIMFSTLAERGAAATIEALSLGADDYVTKVANAGSLDLSLAKLRAELAPKLKQFFRSAAAPAPPMAAAVRSGVSSPVSVRRPSAPSVVAIGVSTGGPAALHQVLGVLPADFPLPVVIVQHMPPPFTRLLAERLHGAGRLKVAEASQGEVLQPGRVLIAPGDHHMRVVRGSAGVSVALDQSPPENSCRPAVDPLFHSVALAYGSRALGVILTGMGQDGLRGAKALKAAGSAILAQDESTSVVWGMPGVVVGAGLADRVIPLPEVAQEILRRAKGGE